MKKILINSEGAHNKFWRYETSGNSVTVEWGRVGLAGDEQVKKFDNPTEMQKFIDKKMREKIRKGYAEVTKEKLKNETKTAQELGTQHKISRLLFVDQRGNNQLHQISNYDPKRYVYVEILNSWKKTITRLLLSKTNSYEISGGVTESDETITYGEKHATSSDFVKGIRNVLRRLSEQVIEVTKTVQFAAVGARNLFGDDTENEGSDDMAAALQSIDTSGVDTQVVLTFAAMGARALEL